MEDQPRYRRLRRTPEFGRRSAVMESSRKMPLSEEADRTYRRTLEVAQRQLEEIDEQIERELAMVRERLADLQEKRRAALQMYDAACTMLGIESGPRSDEEGSDAEPPI